MINREANPIKILLSAECTDGTILYDGEHNAMAVLETATKTTEDSKVNTDEASLSIQIYLPKDEAARLIAAAQKDGCSIAFLYVPTLIEVAS